jgi:hypothetical protein
MAQISLARISMALDTENTTVKYSYSLISKNKVNIYRNGGVDSHGTRQHLEKYFLIFLFLTTPQEQFRNII